MATDTGAFSNLLVVGLRKIYFEKHAIIPDEYSQIFNIDSSTKSYEEDLPVSGLGIAVEKPEGESITYVEPVEGDKKRYTNVSYGLGFRVTHEMYADDQYRIMQKMAKGLAQSMKQRVENIAWAVLNNAFSVTYPGADALELCSDVHPLLGGGTHANEPSTDADLALASLQAGVQAFDDVVDDNGFPILIKPTKLVIPSALRFTAAELIGSTLKPYTGDNEINALRDADLKYFVGHYLTDTDAWFLVGEKGVHDLNFFWREKPKFDNDDDFDTGDAKFKSFMRIVAGHTDWRGVYGSQGA